MLLSPEETSVLPTGDTSFLHVLVSDKPPQNTSTSRSPNQSKQDVGFGIGFENSCPSSWGGSSHPCSLSSQA